MINLFMKTIITRAAHYNTAKIAQNIIGCNTGFVLFKFFFTLSALNSSAEKTPNILHIKPEVVYDNADVDKTII